VSLADRAWSVIVSSQSAFDRGFQLENCLSQLPAKLQFHPRGIPIRDAVFNKDVDICQRDNVKERIAFDDCDISELAPVDRWIGLVSPISLRNAFPMNSTSVLQARQSDSRASQ
jgi:hypothetical protein